MIFGTFNAVPAGKIEYLCEEKYQQAFKPFLTALYNHPKIKSTLYYTGSLLEWMESAHPEFHTVLGELVSGKNVELLGGAYWEPILPLIPSSDRIGQIEVMTTYLRKKFGKRSRGGWITGQIWESQLASNFRSSGMDYVFLDKEAFPGIPGLLDAKPMMTEDQGKMLVIFPIMNNLTHRFLIDSPQSIIDSIRAIPGNDSDEIVISLLLDGHRLGADGSYALCYEQKWLDEFLAAVERAEDWLECVHPGQYLRNTRIPMDKIYIPGSTYDSLMLWTKDGEQKSENSSMSQSNPFYRSFLTKYTESALLYAKMMYIEVLTNQLRGDKYRKRSAKEELWRGQEHYAYWHGPSGGIYCSHLRHYAYNALIEAEKTTRVKGIFKSALNSVDFDMDGNKEYIYNGINYNAYVHSVGAVLFELDYLPISRNYLATFSRYYEDYHSKELREQGYDSYPRQAFLDHFFDPEDQFDNFEECRRKSLLPSMHYTPIEFARDKARVTLSVNASVNSDEANLKIDKTYEFRRSTLEVQYSLTNLSLRTLRFCMGTEINLALDEDPLHRCVYMNTDMAQTKAADERGYEDALTQWSILDDERDVLIHFVLSRAAELWYFPLYTEFRIGRDLQRQYQSSVFIPRLHFEIPPLDTKQHSIKMRISRIKKQS